MLAQQHGGKREHAGRKKCLWTDSKACTFRFAAHEIEHLTKYAKENHQGNKTKALSFLLQNAEEYTQWKKSSKHSPRVAPVSKNSTPCGNSSTT